MISPFEMAVIQMCGAQVGEQFYPHPVARARLRP